MKINFQKAIEEIDLGDYLEAYRGQIVYVWVNPPRAKRLARQQLSADVRRWTDLQFAGLKPEPDKKKGLIAAIGWVKKKATPDAKQEFERLMDAIYAWLADLWNQCPDPETHWTVSDIRTVNIEDPRMYEWLSQKSMKLIEGYRLDRKKA